MASWNYHFWSIKLKSRKAYGTHLMWSPFENILMKYNILMRPLLFEITSFALIINEQKLQILNFKAINFIYNLMLITIKIMIIWFHWAITSIFHQELPTVSTTARCHKEMCAPYLSIFKFKRTRSQIEIPKSVSPVAYCHQISAYSKICNTLKYIHLNNNKNL